MTSSCMMRNYLLSCCPICLNLSLNLSFYDVVYDAKIFVETLSVYIDWSRCHADVYNATRVIETLPCVQ